MRDYYYILGINENANEQEIKTAYRKLSLKFHPDKNNGEKFFEERFKEIQLAYETLSNPAKRTQYNFKLNQFKSTRTNRDNLKKEEEELKRKFEEELGRREEEIKRNYQARENRIKEEFAKRGKEESSKSNPNWTTNLQWQSPHIFLFFFLAIGLIVIIYFALTKTNSKIKPNVYLQSSEGNYSNDFKKLTMEWNIAHSTKDVATFSKLFSNSVILYGKELDKNTCIEEKLLHFKKYPDFSQQIIGDVRVERINESQIKCNFLKQVTKNQEIKNYPSYLIFGQSDSIWQIQVEGDLITDMNLTKNKERGENIANNIVLGDFDGDGKQEYATLITPKFPQPQTENNLGECVGDCNCVIKFSNEKIPTIKIESCISGNPVNEGDLNEDGADEIGILPGWWTSCWKGYDVYTLKNGNWKFLVKPISTHCIQWEKGVDAIEKDLSIKGNVIIRYSKFTGTDIVTKVKSIPIER